MRRYTLARHRAIVTRLSAAQDLAAMDVLLCDKTAGLHKSPKPLTLNPKPLILNAVDP